MKRGARLGLRGRIMAVTLVGAIAVLTTLMVAFNVVLRAQLASDVDNLLRERAAAALASLGTVNGRLRPLEAPDAAATDAETWVYNGSGALEQPNVPAVTQHAADTLARGPRRFATLDATDTRLLAVPVISAGHRVGTLVVGTSLTPSERTARTALIASLIFSALALLAVVAAARWLVARALRPVARMTAEAADWSEHDLDKRFVPGEPHDELTALAATFDAMLDRLADSLRHEQLLTAEVSHELRTPLAKLLAEAELALTRERAPADYRAALEAIRADAEELRRSLETLLATARPSEQTATGAADAGAVARRAAAAYGQLAERRGVAVELDAPSGLNVRVRAALAERALAPLLENAVARARERVLVSVAANGRDVLFSVSDDGPGVPAGSERKIFEPGATGGGSGTGLGLSLARRLARSAGGEVDCESGSGGRFTLRLPALGG